MYRAHTIPSYGGIVGVSKRLSDFLASKMTRVDTPLNFLLSKGVVIEDADAIENFAYLYEVPDKILEYFGKSGLKLGLFSDPESGSEQTELYLEVETALSPKEANEKLSKINHEWLLASGDRDLMALNITLKFI